MSDDKLDPDEIELFRQAVGEIKRLEDDRADPTPPKRDAVPEQRQLDERAVLDQLLAEDYDPADLDMGEEISYLRPGLQQRILRKLRRGQYSIGAELDLHGLTLPEAKTELLAFLHTARDEHTRCVRIIHGKGLRSSNQGPVLKPMVAKWLSRLEAVLAFCTARPADGGSGAVYVLLKK